MNEELLAQIINGMRMNQPQGAVGNVSNNEAAMFSGNPMNGAVAGGAVGNVSNREAAMFNNMAGGISNPMPRINNMRNNLATAGNVGNLSANEAAMFNANNPMNEAVMAQAADEMRTLQEKGAAGNGILSQDEINRFVYLRNMMNPNQPQQESIGMPTDIDGASAGTPMSQDKLNMLLQQLQRMR